MEFEIRIKHLKKIKTKFFNDKEPKEYHKFLVINPEIIPEKYLYIKEKSCIVWISNSLIKEFKINFGDLSKEAKDYKFIINFEENKSAKFRTNNKNWMVLKTQNYFENTIKKIGFWDSDDYFYESVKKLKKENKTPNQAELENKTNWGKIVLFCLPFFSFFFLIFLITKLIDKKTK